MRKDKGFTLIELLAVIVILAIIALIAVPVIMNIITEARKSAFKDTAYGLISAGEMYYASALLDNGMTSDVEFKIKNGEFEGDNKLEVKGALPTSGQIKVTRDGKVALAISNGQMCITKGYDESEINTKDDVENCVLPAEPAKTLIELAKVNDFATSVAACATTGTCATGTPFAIEVAPGDVKNFYVVSDVDNTVTLIMDRNIDETTVAWMQRSDYTGTEEEWDAECDDCGNNNKGPLTALNYLEGQTSGWSNIGNMTYNLTDSKYGTITRTNVKARMLNATEANAIVNPTNDWAYGNLAFPPYGYWTSSASAGTSDGAVYVDDVGGASLSYVNSVGGFGVRPVIEISKSAI